VVAFATTQPEKNLRAAGAGLIVKNFGELSEKLQNKKDEKREADQGTMLTVPGKFHCPCPRGGVTCLE